MVDAACSMWNIPSRRACLLPPRNRAPDPARPPVGRAGSLTCVSSVGAHRPDVDGREAACHRITEADVREAFGRLDPTWDELFPAEQERLVRLLFERVDVTIHGIAIRVRVGGSTALLAEF